MNIIYDPYGPYYNNNYNSSSWILKLMALLVYQTKI